MTQTIDFEKDALAAPVSAQQMRSVAVLVDRLLALKEMERAAEARLTSIKEQRRAVEERDLPEAMDSCGMKEFKLKSGVEVSVESVTSGSISKANQPEAFKWLREHGHSGLIKMEVAVTLARGQDKEREKVLSALKKIKGVDVTEKETVHPQTLGAWAREILSDVKAGAGVPLELLGIWTGRKAKVKEPKEVKKS